MRSVAATFPDFWGLRGPDRLLAGQPVVVGGQAGPTTISRSPPSTEASSGTARRSTVPPTEVVIGASIFIASMVATVCPASTWSPAWTVSETAPAKGAATWAGLSGLGPFAPGTGVFYRAVTDGYHARLAVEPAEHRTKASFVSLPDGVESQVQRNAGPESDLDFPTWRQAKEESRRRQDGKVPVLSGGFLVLPIRAGEKERVKHLAQFLRARPGVSEHYPRFGGKIEVARQGRFYP